MAHLPLAPSTRAAIASALLAALPLAPRQPVHFSHRVHAGESKIGCSSCHGGAWRSPVAGVPSMERCQGCHKFVKRDDADPRRTEALRPIVEWLRQRPPRPIEWVRVHRLPDHVYFTHERHVASGVRCQQCHGEVEKMDEVRQVESLLMGWCLDCHHRAQAERPVALARLTECGTCHK